MPRELITIQVGQCGNQLGCKFWDMALSEHAQYSSSGCFDDSMSSFFRNVSSAGEKAQEIPLGDGRQEMQWLRARAVLVDMEESVLNETLSGPLGELFDSRQMIKDVSGSGNNWAHGHCVYGPKYEAKILDTIRQATELCDSLQSFFLIHSLGGGTGSGLGTYILSMLEDNFPDVYRFTTAIVPSRTDDVITSPYNSMLSLRELVDHADCVLPMENKALIDICNRAGKLANRGNAAGGGKVITSTITGDSHRNNRVHTADKMSPGRAGFDAMNNVAAHVLTNLTCSMRFPGPLNVDLNEITTNMVPFRGLHFLMPSLSPTVATFTDKQYQGSQKKSTMRSRALNRHSASASSRASEPTRERTSGLNQVFTEAFSRKDQLVCGDPRSHMYLSCAIIVRGSNSCVSSIQKNIERMKKKIKMPPWNLDGFKVGICATPSTAAPFSSSALCLANNCAIAGTFRGIQEDFYRIYRRKAHVHHYTEFMEQSRFEEANESVCNLIELYEQLDSSVSYNSAGGIFATKTSTSEQVRPQLFRRTGPVVGV